MLKALQQWFKNGAKITIFCGTIYQQNQSRGILNPKIKTQLFYDFGCAERQSNLLL
jgi:hypothetical protein